MYLSPFFCQLARRQIYAVVFLLIVSGTVAALFSWRNSSALQHYQSELSNAHRVLSDLPVRNAVDHGTDFTQLLGRPSDRGVILRDISRFAQTTSLQLSSLSVQSQTGSEREFGSIQLAVATSGSYSPTKAWLTELLKRYPFMSIQAMAFRAQPSDSSHIEATFSLTVFIEN